MINHTHIARVISIASLVAVVGGCKPRLATSELAADQAFECTDSFQNLFFGAVPDTKDITLSGFYTHETAAKAFKVWEGSQPSGDAIAAEAFASGPGSDPSKREWLITYSNNVLKIINQLEKKQDAAYQISHLKVHRMDVSANSEYLLLVTGRTPSEFLKIRLAGLSVHEVHNNTRSDHPATVSTMKKYFAMRDGIASEGDLTFAHKRLFSTYLRTFDESNDYVGHDSFSFTYNRINFSEGPQVSWRKISHPSELDNVAEIGGNYLYLNPDGPSGNHSVARNRRYENMARALYDTVYATFAVNPESEEVLEADIGRLFHQKYEKFMTVNDHRIYAVGFGPQNEAFKSTAHYGASRNYKSYYTVRQACYRDLSGPQHCRQIIEHLNITTQAGKPDVTMTPIFVRHTDITSSQESSEITAVAASRTTYSGKPKLAYADNFGVYLLLFDRGFGYRIKKKFLMNKKIKKLRFSDVGDKEFLFLEVDEDKSHPVYYQINLHYALGPILVGKHEASNAPTHWIYEDILTTQKLIESREQLDERPFNVVDDKAGVYSVKMSKDCSNFYAVTGGSDGKLKKWDFNGLNAFQLEIPDGQGLQPLDFGSHEGRITDAKINFAGTKMVTASDNGKVKVWDMNSNQLLRTFPDEAMMTPPPVDTPDEQNQASENPNEPPSDGAGDILGSFGQEARDAATGRISTLEGISAVEFTPCEDGVIVAPRGKNLTIFPLPDSRRGGDYCIDYEGRVYKAFRDDVFAEKKAAYGGLPLFFTDLTSYKGFNAKLPTQSDRDKLANSLMASTNSGDLYWLDIRNGQIIAQWLGQTKGTYNLSGGLGYSQVSSSGMMAPIGQWIMAGRTDGNIVSLYNQVIDGRDQTAADSFCVTKDAKGKVQWQDSSLGKLRVFRYTGHTQPVTEIRPIYFLTDANDSNQKTDGMISTSIDGRLIVWRLLDDCRHTQIAQILLQNQSGSKVEQYFETKRELVMRYTVAGEEGRRREIPLLSADVSLDSDWAVSGAADGSIHIWWIGDSMNIE